MPKDEKPRQTFPTVPCKGCGRPIVWAKARRDDGTNYRVPLDPRPAVYAVTNDETLGAFAILARKLMAEVEAGAPPGPGVTYMTSHFNMCPNAGQFSAGTRRTTIQGEGDAPRQEGEPAGGR